MEYSHQQADSSTYKNTQLIVEFHSIYPVTIQTQNCSYCSIQATAIATVTAGTQVLSAYGLIFCPTNIALSSVVRFTRMRLCIWGFAFLNLLHTPQIENLWLNILKFTKIHKFKQGFTNLLNSFLHIPSNQNFLKSCKINWTQFCTAVC